MGSFAEHSCWSRWLIEGSSKPNYILVHWMPTLNGLNWNGLNWNGLNFFFFFLQLYSFMVTWFYELIPFTSYPPPPPFFFSFFFFCYWFLFCFSFFSSIFISPYPSSLDCLFPCGRRVCGTEMQLKEIGWPVGGCIFVHGVVVHLMGGS